MNLQCVRKLSVVKEFRREIATAPMTHADKLAAAIAYLGPRWVLHPQFDRKQLRIGYLQQWRINRYVV